MTASPIADTIAAIVRAEQGETALSIDPSLPADPEPSADAVRFADEMDGQYEEWREASKAMALVCQKLIDHGAAGPIIIRRVKHLYERYIPIDPCDFMGACDDLAEADFRHCWADNAAEFDRQAASQDRQRAAEMMAGK